MSNWAQDVRFATRILLKNRVSSSVAVLTLALGIGATTAIFSILDPLLLRKLPVLNPDELVWVNSAGTLGAAEAPSSEIQSFYSYRDKAQVFSGVLAFAPMKRYELSGDGDTSPINGQVVSGNYFTVLGIRPFAGRLFQASDREGPRNAIVLSFDCWQRVFNAESDVVGRTVLLNNISHTVLGVTPPEFFGAEVGKAPDLYISLEGNLSDADRPYMWVTMIGRLRPGVSAQQAEAALAPLLEETVRASSLPPVTKEQFMARALLTPAARGLSDVRQKFSLPAILLMAVVCAVLLIACANVANLLLARGLERGREISVRMALGAGRWQLVRQFLTESALLAVMGALAGIILAQWASGILLAAISSKRLPVTLAAGFNARVLLFTVGVLGLSAILCGLAPALFATGSDLARDLRVQMGGSDRPSSRSRVGRLLLVAQVALSVMLLASAGLLLRSLVNLETFDTGFDRDQVMVVSMRHATGRSPAQRDAFADSLLDNARYLPGVRSASLAAFPPISGRVIGVNVDVEGYTLSAGETANVLFNVVSPGYFNTMRISLLAGRDFTRQDSREPPRVAIINRTMARRFFGGRNPLGKRFRFVEGNRPPVEIIGVAADSKYNDLREEPMEFFYVPRRYAATLVVRSAGDPRPLTRALPALIRSLDSSVQVSEVKTLREQVGESLHPERLITALCGAFGLLALAITCVGLYGMVSFMVARRTGEIGIRLALGAQRADIFRLVVAEGVVPTIVGLALGCAGAVVSGALLGSLLFRVSAFDLATVAAVSLVLLGAAALACSAPARRAMRIDPIVALRYE